AALVLVVTVLLSYVASRRSVDFPVYHYSARKMLSGTGPLYGPGSGIGWPQVYRYPPLFLVLFIPFALLPLRLAAIIWAALKFLALGFLARALFSRLRTRGPVLQLLSILPALPYLALEFHYGNVQFFIFALVAAALLCLDERPVLAAFALSLAISIKFWLLFFFHLQFMYSVTIRLLVSLHYTQLTDSNYPKPNVATFDPSVIELLWLILALAGCAGLLVLARRQPQSDNLTIHAVAFCCLLLLQP